MERLRIVSSLRRIPPLVAVVLVYWLLLLCSFAPYDPKHVGFALVLCALAIGGTMAGSKAVFWSGVVFTICAINGSINGLLGMSTDHDVKVLVLAARLILATAGLVCFQTTPVLEWFGFRFARYSRQTFWLVCTGFALAFLPGIVMRLWIAYLIRCGLHIA